MDTNQNVKEPFDLVEFPLILSLSDSRSSHDSIMAAYPQDQGPTEAAVEKVGGYPAGCGGHSDVWKANLTKNGHVTSVALKVLRTLGSDQSRLRNRLKREIMCWKLLHHQNIAPFYGVQYQANGAPAIILPWFKNGSADIYLQKYSGADVLQIIKGIVDGVEHLHDRGVIHGDLKGANVMIDDEGRSKLIDFGLARVIDAAGFTTSISTSVRWCAPELLNPNYNLDAKDSSDSVEDTATMNSSSGIPNDVRTTTASDVYAFASTALELLTGQVPYNMLRDSWVLFEIMRGTTPRSLSSAFRYEVLHSAELWHLLESCWVQPSRRPRIQDVRRHLLRLYPCLCDM